ncbi:MAG: hypothetical protein HZB80_08330 [Deltaproteobacteria bacterium]|nr:hypothetical protein [Deltaproteobacteria bacterium]
MVTIHPEYVIDENQNKKAVILPFIEWEQILEEIEELEDIRAFDIAKSEKDEMIPFEQAVQEIRKGQIF